jgi:hypothetical protein
VKSEANRRTARTLIQFVLGGGFATLLAGVAVELSPIWAVFVFSAGSLAVTWVQNYAEDNNIIKTVLPSPPKK